MMSQKRFHSFILVVAVLLQLSCTNNLKPQEGPLGPEATDADFRKVVDEAFADISIMKSIVGDSVTYENNQRIELGPVVKTSQFTHSLIQIKGDNETLKFILFRDQFDFDLANGGIINEVHKELPPLVFYRTNSLLDGTTNGISASGGLTDGTAVTTATNFTSPDSFLKSLKTLNKDFTVRALGSNCDGIDETDPDGTTYDCIKRFNLRSVKRFAPAPDAVSAKPNCMGFPNCQIPVQAISYDEVKWKDGHSVSKVTMSFEIAKVVPDLMYVPNSDGSIDGYTPPVVSACQRGHINYNGSDIIVTLCTILKDFYLSPAN